MEDLMIIRIFQKKGLVKSIEGYIKVAKILFGIFKTEDAEKARFLEGAESALKSCKSGEKINSLPSIFTGPFDMEEMGIKEDAFFISIRFSLPILPVKGGHFLHTDLIRDLIEKADIYAMEEEMPPDSYGYDIYDPDDSDEKNLERLKGDTYDFHYYSNDFIKDFFKGDISFIPFRESFDFGKGMLLLSKQFHTQQIEFYADISKTFDKSRKAANCPECKSTNVKKSDDEWVCMNCGLVLNSEKELSEFEKKYLARKSDKGRYLEIKYKCDNCKAKGTITVEKRFMDDKAPCPECGGHMKNIKIIKAWDVG